MSQTLPSQQEAAPPIRAIIVRPCGAYEVRAIEQNIRTFQELVGGCIDAVSTEWCTFWWGEEGKLKDYPTNELATYLWWKIDKKAEGQDVLQGTVFVTGVADIDGDSLPVPDEVVELFERLERIYRKNHPVVPHEEGGTTGTASEDPTVAAGHTP
jgi:Domain of unknown function (DUF3846)